MTNFIIEQNNSIITMNKIELPKLPYSFSALEPYIDSKTVEIHYTKHHQAYVNGLNSANEALKEARDNGNFAQIKALKKELAFHGSGHYLHSIYWKNLSEPEKSKEYPKDELLEAIEKNFISFGTFVKEFRAATTAIEGSGWGVLAIIDGELEIFTIEKHQDLNIISAIPILVCDVWEHAYYLKYQNKRADYIDNFFKIINWDNVEKNYNKAMKLFE